MVQEALRLLRVFNDIKSKDLAIELGISNSYLSEIEKGKKKPNLDLIQKYADYFKIRPSDILLFSEKINNEKSHVNIRGFLSRKIIEILISVEDEGAKKIYNSK